MKSALSNRHHHGRQGMAVVELAITVPILFLFVFGMIEFGRALMVQQLLANAARDGARSAILEGATVSSVQASVENYLAGSSVSGSTVSVSPDPLTSAQGGDPVTVTVSAPYNTNSWLPSPKFLNSTTLQSTVTMRREVFTSTSSP